MKIHNVDFADIRLSKGFWLNRHNINADVSIGAVRDRFADTRFDALKFEWEEGKEKPHIYYDSDTAKWIEGVAYVLAVNRQKHRELEKYVDDLIKYIVKNQADNGYFNSYFQQVEPDMVFKRRDDHELYCAGHLIEAAVAYYQATGKTVLLKAMERYCEFIHKTFIKDKSAGFVTCGHEEIELALVRLYELTGKRMYKELADFFVYNRGANDLDVFCTFANSRYAQDNAPARELMSAEGHAVRAVYFYSAMADLARINEDKELKDACDRLYDDITKTKMYITGGIGSARAGESFTVSYDLPNLTAYTETCAGIGLVMFCQRMLKLELNSDYADTVERVLYNAFPVSISLDGKRFFYENPLEITLKEKGKETSMLDGHRPTLPPHTRFEKFGCSCCPPNINRFAASVGGLIWSNTDDCLYLNQYIASSTNKFGKIEIKTKYPVDGKVTVKAEEYPFNKLAFRIPGWCKKYTIKLDGQSVVTEPRQGYAIIDTPKSDFELKIAFDIIPEFIECHPEVRDNASKVCLISGPVVYCLEEIDNGANLHAVLVDKKTKPKGTFDPVFGLKTYTCQGFRRRVSALDGLYNQSYNIEKTELRFIPYYAFGNRGDSDMLVWINRKY